jgi:lipopolysaccharide transport system permease protein
MTPVIYPVNFIPEKYRLFMYLNPMAGPIEAFRACVLGHKPVNVEGLAISLCVSGVMFAIGLLYFKRVERTFADVI